jgi:ribosomal protein S3
VVAILYNNAGIISDYLSVIISSDTNHKRSLKKFITIFEIFFFSNLLQLTGFQLRLNGKLNGKMRKSKYHYKVGKVQLQTLKILLNFSLAISYTKFGTISIKT